MLKDTINEFLFIFYFIHFLFIIYKLHKFATIVTKAMRKLNWWFWATEYMLEDPILMVF